MQRPQEALDVGAVLHLDVDVNAAEPGNFLPVSERNKPELVERRVTRAVSPNAGSTDTSAGQNPPSCFISAATAGGMPLRVVIQQRERRSADR